MNATFLMLILKKGNVEDLQDFKSISLVGGLHKLLAKVLSNRLRKVVGRVVSKFQNAFIEGRQFLKQLLLLMMLLTLCKGAILVVLFAN